MLVMDRSVLTLFFFVLGLSLMEDAGAAKVVYEKYDSIRSMLPFFPVRHLSKRQTDGAGEENVTVMNNHHTYYTSKFYPPGESADSLWFELSNMMGSGIGSGVSVEDLGGNTTEILGSSHRVYQVWQLKFTFPFYGHILNAVGVTTGGFLYTGTIYHQQIYLTQYIAPLMADFNPSLTGSGRVLVYSTEERFTVQWDQVLNHHHENDGPFTFQVSIFPNGKIYFAYQQLPLLWNELNNDYLPVEVGIADALYLDAPGDYVIVVEYSRVNASDLLEDENTDLSYSAFEIDPVPNCVTANTCSSCMAITRLGIFNCSWCEAAEQKCSDGVDRFTQDWFSNGCFTTALSTCPLPPISPPKTETSSNAPLLHGTPVPSQYVSASPRIASTSTTLRHATPSSTASGTTFLPIGSVAGITICVTAFLAVVTIIATVGILAIYGARHPTSRIGFFMIKNRLMARRFQDASQSLNYEMYSNPANLYE